MCRRAGDDLLNLRRRGDARSDEEEQRTEACAGTEPEIALQPHDTTIFPPGAAGWSESTYEIVPVTPGRNVSDELSGWIWLGMK